MIVRLDGLLGRVTMYRLLLIVLVGIGAVAVVASALGAVFYSPQAILVSAAVSLAVGYGSNRLFAALWRVRAHGESSLITGMLLLFLFSPALDARSLGALAIGAGAANLSKYLLAWRGRHIFNPVAAGAVVVTLTQLTGPTWWVATPVLLPVVVLGGLLVLHRAHAWDLALPVIAIAGVGTAVWLIVGETAPGMAVWLAFASYPYLFFAAFMVSEPLTAPPRRGQRLLVGALIGILALVPVHLGFVSTSPELALVIGNLAAFGFGQRRRVRLTLVERRELPAAILELSFAPESALRFRAGQYLELSLPHAGADGRGARRVFSIANRPGAATVLVATRSADPGSSFKAALLALEPGATLAGSAVGGDFVLPSQATTPLLWITGGIGITPFSSFADDLAQGAGRTDVDVVLLWVVRGADELVYADVFDRAGVRVALIGPDALATEGVLPDGWTYAGPTLDENAVRASVPDAAGRSVFIAGSPRVVQAGRDAARGAGARRIRTDRFLGY